MGTKRTRRYCRHCKVSVLAVGTKPNHLFHLFMSVITVGVWLLVWALIVVFKVGGYRCSQCGNKAGISFKIPSLPAGVSLGKSTAGSTLTGKLSRAIKWVAIAIIILFAVIVVILPDQNDAPQKNTINTNEPRPRKAPAPAVKTSETRKPAVVVKTKKQPETTRKPTVIPKKTPVMKTTVALLVEAYKEGGPKATANRLKGKLLELSGVIGKIDPGERHDMMNFPVKSKNALIKCRFLSGVSGGIKVGNHVTVRGSALSAREIPNPDKAKHLQGATEIELDDCSIFRITKGPPKAAPKMPDYLTVPVALKRNKLVADAISKAKETSRSGCKSLSALSEAWKAIKIVKETDKQYRTAKRLVASLERCRKRVSKSLHRKARLAATNKRKSFARIYERLMLDKYMNVAVGVKGKGSRTLTIKYILVSKVFVHHSQKNNKFLLELNGMGFNKVYFTDGLYTKYTLTFGTASKDTSAKDELTEEGLESPLKL